MKQPDPHAIVVVDLAYGDCGKGTIVDYLAAAHGAHTVVRFNGGPQAGHNVVTPDRRHHTFSQIGSGAFVAGVRTLLSRFTLIEPYAMLNEARHLAALGVREPLAGVSIDRRCAVITPAHQAANRIREIARGAGAHGTCGMGVGEAVADTIERPELTIRAGELADRHVVHAKLRAIRDVKYDELRDILYGIASRHPAADLAVRTLRDASWIDAAVDNYAHLAALVALVDEARVRSILSRPGVTIFEGAQGVLLDEWVGFHPHTTWSTTTFANAQTLLAEAGHCARRTRLGVLRCYFTRHGAGPFVSGADPDMQSRLPEPHNDAGGWQGAFRVGRFDAVAARYAVAATGPVDALAVTHLDRAARLPAELCTAYEIAGEDDSFVATTLGVATDIRPVDPNDFARRRRLTDALRRCRPVFTALSQVTADTFVRAIERELRVPVRLTSAGPTRHDKHCHPSGWLD